MDNWSEIHISIIYFSGILASIMFSITLIWYLKLDKGIISQVGGHISSFWNNSFKISIALSGLLGAMSVSFRDCNGKYNDLLESEYNTVLKGIEQISYSINYLSVLLGIWLLIFIAIRIKPKKHNFL